jgi:iron complex outermembrane receptor protein
LRFSRQIIGDGIAGKADRENVGKRAVRVVVRMVVPLAATYLCFGQTTLPDFGNLSLDQLANIKITSFTKKEQKLSQVAGAVYVITQEQIARSGLTSVPELLRIVPGIHVARLNGDQWSVSGRGAVGAFSNKLLVLIDGRSIYSPVFSGVYWDLGMPLLENIERIEVIRGPGATIWGANAVSGVIDIITKNSQDTHGGKNGITVTSGAGSSERAFGSVSIGGAIGGSTTYRGYYGGSDSEPLSLASGASAGDGRNSMQSGFRLDGAHQNDSWMLEGDLFRGLDDNTGINPDVATQSLVYSPAHFNTLAGNVTGEWRRTFSERSELKIQSYYDYANRPNPQISELVTRTWDTELQYDFTAGNVHNFAVGGGDSLISEKVASGGEVTFNPAQLTYVNLNAFAQDEMHFAHDKLLVTAGAKLEYDHFGGRAVEPSVNLMWLPTKRHSIWVSSARSLRTPSLFDVAVDAPFKIDPASSATGGLPILFSLVGSPSFSAELVKDVQAGYRSQISKAFSLDLAAFYDNYSNLRSFVVGSPVLALSPLPQLDVTGHTGNGASAVGKGAEGSLAWQVLPFWKLEGSYTYDLINQWLSSSAPSGAMPDIGGSKEPPRSEWRLQSYINLSKKWEADTFIYWTGEASPVNIYGPNVSIPAYTRLDVRVGYRVGPHWQLSLAGQNLLEARHLEGIPELLTDYSYVNRGVYLKSTWQF